MFARAMWKTDLFGNTSAPLNCSILQLRSSIFSNRTVQLNRFILHTGFILYIFSGIGITAGAHRLWSHRAYKAKFPLRVFLMILDTMAFQVGSLVFLFFSRSLCQSAISHILRSYFFPSSQSALYNSCQLPDWRPEGGRKFGEFSPTK